MQLLVLSTPLKFAYAIFVLFHIGTIINVLPTNAPVPDLRLGIEICILRSASRAHTVVNTTMPPAQIANLARLLAPRIAPRLATATQGIEVRQCLRAVAISWDSLLVDVVGERTAVWW